MMDEPGFQFSSLDEQVEGKNDRKEEKQKQEKQKQKEQEDQKDEIGKLQQKIKELESQIVKKHVDLCVICQDKPIEYVVLSCGHYCLCGDCAKILQQTKKKQCPLCRLVFSKLQRVFV
jgi:hypothetical protein